MKEEQQVEDSLKQVIGERHFSHRSKQRQNFSPGLEPEQLCECGDVKKTLQYHAGNYHIRKPDKSR